MTLCMGVLGNKPFAIRHYKSSIYLYLSNIGSIADRIVPIGEDPQLLANQWKEELTS